MFNKVAEFFKTKPEPTTKEVVEKSEQDKVAAKILSILKKIDISECSHLDGYFINRNYVGIIRNSIAFIYDPRNEGLDIKIELVPTDSTWSHIDTNFENRPYISNSRMVACTYEPYNYLHLIYDIPIECLNAMHYTLSKILEELKAKKEKEEKEKLDADLMEINKMKEFWPPYFEKIKQRDMAKV